MSTALVALIMGALAGASMGAIARSEVETERDVSTSAQVRDADKVDGKHAIGFTNQRGRRAGKLVATNKGGWLPSNIVQPLWHLIKNKPAGFADGVDDQGVTGIRLTRISVSQTVDGAVGSPGYLNANCPAGSKVTGGGFTQPDDRLFIRSAAPFNDSAFSVSYLQSTAGQTSLGVFAICLSADPPGAVTTASRKRS